MSKTVRLIKLYMSDIDRSGSAEERIEELLNDGYVPLIQLVSQGDYTVWAFVKEDGSE